MSNLAKKRALRLVAGALAAGSLVLYTSVPSFAASAQEKANIPYIQEKDIDAIRDIVDDYDHFMGANRTLVKDVSSKLEGYLIKWLTEGEDFKYFPVTTDDIIKLCEKNVDVLLNSSIPNAKKSAFYHSFSSTIHMPSASGSRDNAKADLQEDMSYWISSACHEFGHALGFNEGMSELLAERITGSNENKIDFIYTGMKNIYKGIYQVIGAENFWPMAFSPLAFSAESIKPFEKAFKEEDVKYIYDTINNLKKLYENDATIEEKNSLVQNYFNTIKGFEINAVEGLRTQGGIKKMEYAIGRVATGLGIGPLEELGTVMAGGLLNSVLCSYLYLELKKGIKKRKKAKQVTKTNTHKDSIKLRKSNDSVIEEKLDVETQVENPPIITDQASIIRKEIKKPTPAQLDITDISSMSKDEFLRSFRQKMNEYNSPSNPSIPFK